MPRVVANRHIGDLGCYQLDSIRETLHLEHFGCLLTVLGILFERAKPSTPGQLQRPCNQHCGNATSKFENIAWPTFENEPDEQGR